MIFSNFLDKRNHFTFLLFLFAIFLLPFISNAIFLNSLSYSLLSSFALFVIYCYFVEINLKFSINFKLNRWIFFIFLHGLIFSSINTYNQSPNLPKLFLSLIYFMFVLVFSDFTCHVFKKLNPSFTYKTFNFFSYFLLIGAIFSAFGFLFVYNGGRPIFFYAEPSHFVLAFIPFLVYKIATSRKYELFIFSASSFKLALIFPSATLLSALLVYPVLTQKLKHLILIFISFISVLLMPFIFNFTLDNLSNSLTFQKSYAFINNHIIPENRLAVSSKALIPNMEYFTDRLPNNYNANHNLSLSTYMSGWARAFINTRNTYGMGIGFQQLGYIGAIDKYIQQIMFDNPFDMNSNPFGINEGGCVAAKLISEFGIFAIIGILFYLGGCLSVIKRIRSVINNSYLIDLRFLIDIFYISFLIPLFVRSFGYFTPLLFILFISIIYNKDNKS